METINKNDSGDEIKKGRKFSYFEPIAGIIFALAATIIFLGFPQIITVVYIGGPRIETFNIDIIRSLWLPIILWAVFRIGVEVAYIAEHRYTKRLANISLVGNILAAICTFIILISIRIVNPDYIAFINDYYANVAVWFGNILARPNLIILIIIMLVLILESINVMKRGYKAEKTDEQKEQEAAQKLAQQDPEKINLKNKFSIYEPIKGILFTLVVTILFLGFPQIIAYVFYGHLIPSFVTSSVQALWLPIILWAVFRIGNEIFFVVERGYTKRLALVTTVGNVLAAICGLLIFLSPRIVNPEYVNFIHTYFEDMAVWFSAPLTSILDKPNIIILVIMVVVFALEIFAVFRKSKENEEENNEAVKNEAAVSENKPESV